MTASLDARDDRQPFLLEPTFLNRGSDTVGHWDASKDSASHRKTGINRNQPGYSGIKRAVHLITPSDPKNQAASISRQNMPGGECRSRSNSDGLDRAKNPVNSLNFA